MNPFEHHYFIGYVSQVFPQFARIHFPTSVLLNGFTHLGQEFNGGLIGNFVVIEGDKFGFLGRITELSLPESERLALNEKAFQTSDFHPTGRVEILLSFDLYNPLKVRKGLDAHPNIGAKVFVSSGKLVQDYLSKFGVKDTDINPPIVHLGNLVSNPSTSVSVSLQSIFGRHCAVVGTTGGGKSYTLGKLLESITKTGNKAILIDATGEHSINDGLSGTSVSKLGEDTHFHYKNLTISDLFVMFRPSGQVQQPILLEAITSLRLAKLLENQQDKFDVVETGSRTKYKFTGQNAAQLELEVDNGCIIKGGKPTAPFNRLRAIYTKELNNYNRADFDISKLNQQIKLECHQNFGDRWNANVDDRNYANSTSLILRIHNALSDPDFNNVFGFNNSGDKKDIIETIDQFLTDSGKISLRISFDKVHFSFQIREILANAIGTHLLSKAREGFFNDQRSANGRPLILIIDEAHQFINKSVKDEYFDSTKLEAYDSISKECRKHGLFLCISTQMPRDIPQGTLSQMGTFIVHRLINQNDKDAINNACSSANRNTLDFLPVLGEGEAILTGVDFPMPIIMKFKIPEREPSSNTPRLRNIDTQLDPNSETKESD